MKSKEARLKILLEHRLTKQEQNSVGVFNAMEVAMKVIEVVCDAPEWVGTYEELYNEMDSFICTDSVRVNCHFKDLDHFRRVFEVSEPFLALLGHRVIRNSTGRSSSTIRIEFLDADPDYWEKFDKEFAEEIKPKAKPKTK